ncbi:MAG: hypothetical protein AVDCRST_MAG64-2507 [uncultured Phycisphaerae bacterium]|uniref:STAS domain-containing protein n=1 Tax=uncultured Phycisphaerae bacterium TaxID=904963 RepID=A0A6J4PF54_9BACT|nr:MAG: hypothetical protein AVDCRST_MAG64-2507 [uncultured Phycisphaerae bacterium]
MSRLHATSTGHSPWALRNTAATGQCAEWGVGQAVECDMATLEQRDVDGVRVLRVSGSLTQQGVQGMEPEFAQALPDGARAVVDIGDVDLITTPGLALILGATQRLRRTGGRVVFTAVRPPVRELLHRCRLDQVLEMAEAEPEALERAKH